MDFFDLDPRTRATITQLCADEGIAESYAVFVARHLDVADASWRWCCSSRCDPCVEQLGRVVDRARQVLCMKPPGSPERMPKDRPPD